MQFKPFVPEPGYCRCRHRVKLNGDGSNPCSCCDSMWPDDGGSYDFDDDPPMTTDHTPAPDDAAARIGDELGYPITSERVDALLALFMFQSDTTSREVGLVVRALRSHIERLTRERDEYKALALAYSEGVLIDAPALAERMQRELAAERTRNAPLRARVKAVQDRADQEQSLLKREIARHRECDDFWRDTNMTNYRRFRAAESERDEARAELAAIREIAGGLDNETTLAAVQDIVTEWKHYSKEMNKAGYETIPTLTRERDAAREAGKALIPYLHHGWCDSVATINEPDCRCGLRAKVNRVLAAAPTGPELGAGEGEEDV